MEFIPNGMFKEFEKLLAKNDEERVEILHSFSDYETRKSYISKEQSEEFKFPCIDTVGKDCKYIKKFYTSRNDRGHFNIPKVIFSTGRSGSTIIDESGEYGLTQFAYAIVDEPKNLPYIKKALDSIEFVKLLKFADSINSQKYNRKVISLFRKDFWKEFLK
jgi:hypothetical protein